MIPNPGQVWIHEYNNDFDAIKIIDIINDNIFYKYILDNSYEMGHGEFYINIDNFIDTFIYSETLTNEQIIKDIIE
jgi:hypothetical protein